MSRDSCSSFSRLSPLLMTVISPIWTSRYADIINLHHEIKTHYWNLFVDSKNVLPQLFVSVDRSKIIYLYFLLLNVGWAALKVFI